MSIKTVDSARYRAAHDVLFIPWVALLGQVAYALCCVMVYVLYHPITPTFELRLWSIITLTIFGLVAVFDLAFVVRRPNTDEIFHFWRRIDKAVPQAFDLIAVAVLFLLYPHAPESLKVLTTAFFIGYVPLQMISDPENTFGNRFSIVAVLGAFCLTLLINGAAIERTLAVMVLIYGGVLNRPGFTGGWFVQ